MKHNIKLSLGLIGIIALTGVLSGCATISANDPNAANLSIVFVGFPKSALGNAPYIRTLDGKVMLNIYKKKFTLLPGEHKARVDQKRYGRNWYGKIEFRIPRPGSYVLTITRIDDKAAPKGKFKLSAKLSSKMMKRNSP